MTVTSAAFQGIMFIRSILFGPKIHQVSADGHYINKNGNYYIVLCTIDIPQGYNLSNYEIL